MKLLVTGGFCWNQPHKKIVKRWTRSNICNITLQVKKENHQKGNVTYFDYDISSQHTLGIYVDHNSYHLER